MTKREIRQFLIRPGGSFYEWNGERYIPIPKTEAWRKLDGRLKIYKFSVHVDGRSLYFNE